jgi:hypothetical protein
VGQDKQVVKITSPSDLANSKDPAVPEEAAGLLGKCTFLSKNKRAAAASGLAWPSRFSVSSFATTKGVILSQNTGEASLSWNEIYYSKTSHVSCLAVAAPELQLKPHTHIEPGMPQK